MLSWIAAAVVLHAGQMGWAPSVQAAKSYAIRSGKPLMIVNQNASFMGLGGVLNDSRLAVFKKDFVCLAISSPEAATPVYKIPAKWGLIYILITEPNGKLLGRMGGLYIPDAMLDSAKQILWARKADRAIFTAIERGKADASTFAKASIIYALRGEFERSVTCLKKAETEQTPPALLRKSYLTLGDQYRVDRKHQEAIFPLTRAAALSKGDAQVFDVRVRLAASYLRVGDFDRARAEAAICRGLKGITDEERVLAINQLTRINTARDQQNQPSIRPK